MIQSRCGLECSKCKYSETMNCNGCVNITKPFWGEVCVIKKCCEEKNHAHCGECGEFPCENLIGFAYDENQGDNGKRIETCKLWKTIN